MIAGKYKQLLYCETITIIQLTDVYFISHSCHFLFSFWMQNLNSVYCSLLGQVYKEKPHTDELSDLIIEPFLIPEGERKKKREGERERGERRKEGG